MNKYIGFESYLKTIYLQVSDSEELNKYTYLFN